MKDLLTLANFISLSRIILCFYSCYFYLTSQDRFIFSGLILLVIVLDGLDGIVARKLNQASDLGAKIDIISDRIVELVYWLFFAYLGYIAYWVFAYFLLRGIIVDLISFKTNKPLGDSWIRSSRVMRAFYGALKVLSFVLLAFMPDSLIVQIIVYLTVLVNFLRAWPVIAQKLKLF